LKIELQSSEVGPSDGASRAIPVVGRRARENRTAVAAEALLEGEAEALTRKAIELALAGDTTALRLCLERVVPPRKDRPISLALPVISSADDANQAMHIVTAAVGEGRITPSEATNLAALIEVSRSRLPLEPPPPKRGLTVINVQSVKAETAWQPIRDHRAEADRVGA
jgi:hypothetical protein